jgi:iron complex transport system ATP-binding protein
VTTFTAKNLQVDIGGNRIVDGVDIDISIGGWTCIIGPNGAGKSSLLKALAGIVPSTGEMHINDQDVRNMNARARACWIAYVAQEPVMPPGMSVIEYVMLGRTAHLPLLARETPRDLVVCDFVLDELDLNDFRNRHVATLSGGERQRVAIARALAQASPIVLLDEPTTALDIGYQQEVLELIDRLRHEHKIAVLSTMHDLTVSGLFPDRLVMLAGGTVLHEGTAKEVLTPQRIQQAYGAEVRIIEDERGPIVVPLRRADGGTASIP